MNLKGLSIFTFITLLFFNACAPEESLLHYEFDGNTLTRFNKGNKVYLYDGAYLHEDLESLEASAVIDWQFDDGLFWFIQFQPDKTILIFSGGSGKLESIKEKNSKLVYSEETTELLEPYQNDSRKYNNLYQLSNHMKLEEERNAKFGSKVKREVVKVN